jgi:acyl-coenzyme A thioesterase PaaI-like protein
MKELPHTRSCFVCGESNPSGLKLRFLSENGKVTTRFTPSLDHIGFKNTVHGGLIATLLDESMVWACAVQTRRFAFCAELNIRFLKPLQPGRETSVAAELVENRKNKIYHAKAELRDGETILATGTGKYLPISDDLTATMAEDFIGNGEF